MDIRFKLKELLEKHAPSELEQRGLFRMIEEWSRRQQSLFPDRVVLERHKLSRLFRNEERSVSFEVLGTLCEFLVTQCGVPAHVLPHELFGTTDHHVLDLFAKINEVQFYVGMRSSSEWGPNKYVMASDAAFQSRLTTLLTRHLSTRREKVLEGIDTIFVDAPPRNVKADTKTEAWSKVKASAAAYYRKFQKSEGVAMALTGSMKVNCVVEQHLSSLFGESPFATVNARTAAERKVPIFIRYREADPQPASCLGGVRVADDTESALPGIYYERADGTWECLPCNDKTDAAVVVYSRRKKRNQVVLACIGFSSNATHYFRQALDHAVDEFWPPQVKKENFVLGMFLLQFSRKPSAAGGPKSEIPELDDYQIVRLDDEVVRRRGVR